MPPLNTKERNEYLNKILAPAFLLLFMLWAHVYYLCDNIEAVHEQALQIEKNLKQSSLPTNEMSRIKQGPED